MTTTPRPAVDHRTLPRKKRAPSARDQAILLAYRVEGRTQQSLADDYHLSQRRISTIISRVERWRADLIPAAEGELSREQQGRYERWLERERLQAIHTRAMRVHDAQQAELKTIRVGDRDGKPFREETTRQQQPSVQFLKTALNACGQLSKLNDKPPLNEQEPKESRQQFWQVCQAILNLRHAAALRGEITIDDFDAAAVKKWLDALLGKGSRAGILEAPSSARVSDPAESEAARSNENVETEDDGALRDAHALDEDAVSSGSNCSNPAAAASFKTPAAELPEPIVTSNPPMPFAAQPAADDPGPALPPEIQAKLEQLPEERRRFLQPKLAQLLAHDEANRQRREAEARS